MKKIWNSFLGSFVNGIALLLPVVITIALIRFLVVWVNDAILNPVMKFVVPEMWGAQHNYVAKILVFFLVIITVILIGWGAKVLFINRVFSLGERIVLKVPVMGRIYNAAKQIFSSLLGDGKTIFKSVVLVEYPRKGLYSLGFTTGKAKGELKELIGGDGVTVFVATTPNPTSGVFLVVPEESVRVLKMSVEEGMKLVISGGSIMDSLEVNWGTVENDGGAKC
jgi:uncharacterized membrane protein